jgi:hypothetical protein
VASGNLSVCALNASPGTADIKKNVAVAIKKVDISNSMKRRMISLIISATTYFQNHGLPFIAISQQS